MGKEGERKRAGSALPRSSASLRSPPRPASPRGEVRGPCRDGLHAERRGQGGGGEEQDDRQEPAGRRREGGQGGEAAPAR